jgi:hypothetical protein
VKLHSKLPALAVLGRHLGIFGHCSEKEPLRVCRTTHRPIVPRSTQPDVELGL